MPFVAPFTVMAIAGLGLWLSGCNLSATLPPSNSPQPTPTANKAQEKKVILTTFTVLADMAQNVAGDKAIVESITKVGAEIHGYQPTPSDLVRAQKADVILDNGLNLELWAQRFYSDLAHVPHITISEGIQPIYIAESNDKPNPHAWMSPQNALIYVENIRKALVAIDPVNTATYTKNAKAYSEQIQALDRKLRQELAVLPANNRYMVTCEGAFSYIIRDYGLQEGYLWAVNSEQQATPKQIEKVIKLVRTNKIPVVFCESTVRSAAQEQVAREAGAKFGGVFYVDSLTGADGDAPTYIKLLEYNINTLIHGLQGK